MHVLQRPDWHGSPVSLGELFIVKKNGRELRASCDRINSAGVAVACRTAARGRSDAGLPHPGRRADNRRTVESRDDREGLDLIPNGSRQSVAPCNARVQGATSDTAAADNPVPMRSKTVRNRCDTPDPPVLFCVAQVRLAGTGARFQLASVARVVCLGCACRLASLRRSVPLPHPLPIYRLDGGVSQSGAIRSRSANESHLLTAGCLTKGADRHTLAPCDGCHCSCLRSFWRDWSG
jgi:hypothetical protein